MAELDDLDTQVLLTELGGDTLIPTPITGEALLYNILSAKPVSSGVKKLDLLLDGGLRSGEIVEIFGRSNSGKTQLCHKIMSTIACRPENDMSALYMDLHFDFSALRFHQFCQRKRVGKETVRIVRASGMPAVMKALELMETKLCHRRTKFIQKLRVILIDAVPFAVYPIMDSGNTSRVMQGELVMLLKTLASNHNLTIVIVNHGVSRLDRGPDRAIQGVKPALGSYWSHVPNCRILLSCIKPKPPFAQTSEEDPSVRAAPAPPQTVATFRAEVTKSTYDQTHRYFDLSITEDDII